MIKKTLKIVVVLGLLLAGHEGYVRVFAAVTAHFRTQVSVPIVPDAEQAPKAKQRREAERLAKAAFGEGHWCLRSTTSLYYSAERGYWMFFEDYERKKEGKQFTFKPVAVIWSSKDGRTLKTLTGDKAVADFDQPVDAVKPGAKSGHVVHASITDRVLIRDDKGTPNDPADDLVIGPLTYVEYDEPSLQIKSDSDVLVRDRDMKATGVGLRIDLRPHAEPGRTGFNGAKTVRLLKNVHVETKNVGRSGILPGTAKGGGNANAPTPLDIQCKGEMVIELPPPAPPLKRGAPRPPPEPTLAWFYRNVRVRRGTDLPDQLDCDELFLTLLPTPKAPVPVDWPPPLEGPPAEGPLTELTLHRAEATGHTVWLQSEAQALKARGNQLIYEKLAPAQPDKTYFRGTKTTPLWIEKIEYNEQGKVRFIDTIRTGDVTLFEEAQGGGGVSSMVARGPGWLETRAEKSGPVERTASWQDQLVMQTHGQGAAIRRIITLTGTPKVADQAQGTLEARTKIVAHMKPKSKAPVKSEAGSANDTFQIERMEAVDDVVMDQGGDQARPGTRKQHIEARHELNVKFEPAPAATSAATPSAATSAAPAAAPGVPVAGGASAGPAPATTAAAGSEEAVAKEVKTPAEPGVEIRAERIWATIAQKPDGGKGEVKEAKLRGAVAIHQDPAAGKARGTDATGDAADMFGQGEGLYKVLLHGPVDAPAEIINDEFQVRGPILLLDQATNFAKVEGPGLLKQMVQKSMLNEEGLGAEPAADKDRGQSEKDRPAKVPMTVTWNTKMEFRGRSKDLKGRTVGKADFFGDAVAETEDAVLNCEHLETFMDRPVTLNKPHRDPGAPPAEPEPRAQIAFIRCTSPRPEQVVVVNTKRDPKTRAFLEKQHIQGQLVTYDKLTGRYEVKEDGLVLLYAFKADGQAGTPSQIGAGPGRTIRPTAADGRTPARRPQLADARPPARPQKTLELTQVHFSDSMKGKFGSGKDAAGSPRTADFVGEVEVIHAAVANESRLLDPDNPPREYVFMTSRVLRVISEPPPPGSRAPARTFLNGLYDANALSRDAKEGREMAIQGDQITYDSSKKLFYMYAFPGREVHLTQQANPGQPASNASGESAFYNLGTGESGMTAPRSFRLFDGNKSAFRTFNVPPPPDPKPAKTRRREFRLPSNSDKERQGYRGH